MGPLPEGIVPIPEDDNNPKNLFSELNSECDPLDSRDYSPLTEAAIVQTKNYFYASINYLIRHGHDEFMCELGQDAGFAINAGLVGTQVTNSPNLFRMCLFNELPSKKFLEGLEKLENDFYEKGLDQAHIDGFSQRILEYNRRKDVESYHQAEFFENLLIRTYPQLTKPRIALMGAVSNNDQYCDLLYEGGHIILHPSFVADARKDPVDTIATAVYLLSKVRDLKNGKYSYYGPTQTLTTRAGAYTAHFLINAQSLEPKLELSKFMLEILEDFPQGLHTPGLPKGIVYNSPPVAFG